jgi:hypothetical protein
MATLTVQPVVAGGTAATYQAAAGGGDAMATGPANFLHVKNGGGSSVTVSVAAFQQCSQGSLHGIGPVTVPNGSERMIGPVTNRYADPATGLAPINYSGVTTVTVGAFSVSG